MARLAVVLEPVRALAIQEVLMQASATRRRCGAYATWKANRANLTQAARRGFTLEAIKTAEASDATSRS